MEIEILMRPGSSAARIVLDQGESVTAEGGAMIAMSDDMRVQTSTFKKNSGGLLGTFKRLLAGESLFFNEFTAGSHGGDVYIGTTLPGDMEILDVTGRKIILQAGSFVAATNDVSINTSWQGAKNFISGESLFWLELTGQGPVIINAFGVIYPVEVDGEYIVDTGHIVAFEDTLRFEISKVGASWLGSFLGGEGFICKFRGKGTVWCQSHSSSAWGMSMSPYLKTVK